MKRIDKLREKLLFFLILCSLVLIFPLILQTIERPVGLWDYFTIWNVNGISVDQIYDHFDIFNILKNLFLKNDYCYRPFSVLFYLFFIKIFYGNFWILMCFKWAAKFACLYLLWLFNKKVKGNIGIYFFAFSFLLFHTSCFEIMTFSIDGYAALFCLWLTYYIYSKFCKYKSYNLIKYTTSEYYLLLIIFALTSGQKEICLIVLLTTVLLFTLTCYFEKRWSFRLIPIYVITIFVAFRIITIAFSRASVSSEKNIIYMFCRSIYLIFETGTAYGAIMVSMILIFIIAAYKCIKQKDDRNDSFFYVIYLLATIAGMLLFNCISVDQMAPRYVIPVCFLLGELVLLVCRNFNGIENRALLAVGIMIPVLCLSNICAQHLAYAKQFEEQQILFDYILDEKEKQPDMEIIVTGMDELSERFFSGVEVQRSIKHFFGYLGNKWYGIPKYNVITAKEYVENDANYNKEALYMTTYNMIDAEKIIKDKKITKICYANPRIKVLQDIYNFWLKVDDFLKLRSTVTYDVGSCELRDDSYWNLYTVSGIKELEEEHEESGLDTFFLDNYTNNEHMEVKIGDMVSIPKDECANLTFDFREGSKYGFYILHGMVKIHSGSILYGFSDKLGNMYCAKELSASGEKTIEMPFVYHDDTKDAVLFFYVPEQETDVKFEIKNLNLHRENIDIIELDNVMSYGSFQ